MYTQYYGLTRKPFENTPDPDFLYLSENHREVLASLVYGVNSAKGLILAMGDVGTGKTTLINALQKKLDPSYIILRITNPRLVSGRSTFTNILEYFAGELGLLSDTTNNRDLIEAVTDELETLDRSGRRAVLIIDEAHLLSEESLHDIRLLSNIENEKTKLIQILLIGQNELNSKLQEDSLKALKQRFNITRRLMPLDKSETTNYIMHRLRVAGGDSQIFDKKALSLIFKKSSGVPRLINQICDSSLLIGYAVEAHSIGSRVVKEVINDMNAVYEQQETRSISFLHKWRWPVTWATLVLLITVIGAMLALDRSFFPRDWGRGDEPISERSQTSMVKQNSLKSQTKNLSTGDTKPLDPGSYTIDNEKGPLKEKTEETKTVTFHAGNRKPSSEPNKPSGRKDQEIASQGDLSMAKDGDATESKGFEGQAMPGLDRDRLVGPFPTEETKPNQDTLEAEGYYKVKKEDTFAKIAALKDVYDDPLKWPSLFRLNLDTLSAMTLDRDFDHKELPEGLYLKYVTPEEVTKNLAQLAGKPWVVNALSTRTYDKIVPSAVKLIKNGHHVYITKTNIKGDKWIRLRVGFFETPSGAASVQNEIASILKVDDVWVTKIGRELEEYGGY
jgi:general secretion pathway protein A